MDIPYDFKIKYYYFDTKTKKIIPLPDEFDPTTDLAPSPYLVIDDGVIVNCRVVCNSDSSDERLHLFPEEWRTGKDMKIDCTSRLRLWINVSENGTELIIFNVLMYDVLDSLEQLLSNLVYDQNLKSTIYVIPKRNRKQPSLLMYEQ